MKDFEDEIVGYKNNAEIMVELSKLKLASGVENISQNLISCYETLIEMKLVGADELPLVHAWLRDLDRIQN